MPPDAGNSDQGIEACCGTCRWSTVCSVVRASCRIAMGWKDEARENSSLRLPYGARCCGLLCTTATCLVVDVCGGSLMDYRPLMQSLAQFSGAVVDQQSSVVRQIAGFVFAREKVPGSTLHTRDLSDCGEDTSHCFVQTAMWKRQVLRSSSLCCQVAILLISRDQIAGSKFLEDGKDMKSHLCCKKYTATFRNRNGTQQQPYHVRLRKRTTPQTHTSL